mgnify:CR=1 FL=1
MVDLTMRDPGITSKSIKDEMALESSLEKAKALYDYIEDSKTKNPFKVYSYLINKNKEVLKVINILKESLAESLPTSSRDGNFIKKGRVDNWSKNKSI